MTAVPNLRNWRTRARHTRTARHTKTADESDRGFFHFSGNLSQFGGSCSVVTWLLLFCSRYGFGATGRFCAHARRDVAFYLSGAHLDPTRRKFSDGSEENLFFFPSLCHDKKFLCRPRTRVEDLRQKQDADLWTLRELIRPLKSRSVTQLLMVRALMESRQGVDFFI